MPVLCLDSSQDGLLVTSALYNISFTLPLAIDVSLRELSWWISNNSFYIKQVKNSIVVPNSKVSQRLKDGRNLNLGKQQALPCNNQYGFTTESNKTLLVSWLEVRSLVPFLTIIYFQGTLILCLSCGGNKVLASVWTQVPVEKKISQLRK